MFRRRREAGSITPIWLLLITTTLFLLILFVDREWVNYQVRKANQVADFAAEAGASTAQITYILQVDGQIGELTEFQECADEICQTHLDWKYHPWSTTCAGTLKELSGDGWFARCGCRSSSAEVQIECQSVEQLDPEIRLPAAAEELTMVTFAANWIDHPNSRVTIKSYYPEPTLDRRLSSLYLKIRITSLFGGTWWPVQEYFVTGQATLKIPPLQLSL